MGVELVLHVRPKGEDGAVQVQELIQVIKGSAPTPRLGLLLKVHIHTALQACPAQG